MGGSFFYYQRFLPVPFNAAIIKTMVTISTILGKSLLKIILVSLSKTGSKILWSYSFFLFNS